MVARQVGGGAAGQRSEGGASLAAGSGLCYSGLLALLLYPRSARAPLGFLRDTSAITRDTSAIRL